MAHLVRWCMLMLLWAWRCSVTFLPIGACLVQYGTFTLGTWISRWIPLNPCYSRRDGCYQGRKIGKSKCMHMPNWAMKKYPLSHLISWNTTWLQGVQPRVIIISNQLARTIPYNIAQRVQRFADRFESWRVWTSVPKTPGVVAIRMRKNWLHFNGLRGLTQCMQGFSGLAFSKASSIATYKRLVKKVLAKSWAKVTNFSVLPTSECCLSHGGSPVVTHSFQDYMTISGWWL
jgi:hypothetical protein